MFTKMHKKNWLSPDNQSLTNLKSNTMKNDAKVQRLAVPRNYLQEKSFECVMF